MERRYLPNGSATVEMRDAEVGIISGYGSVYYDGSPGSQYELYPGVFERVMPGAWDRVISENDDARGLFNHDTNMILGRRSAGTLRLISDPRGLRYEIDKSSTTVYANLKEWIARRDVTGSSVSFQVSDEQWLKENGQRIRLIRGFKPLYDVGPVTFPAFEATSAGIRAAGLENEWRESLKQWEAKEATERRKRVAVVASARARLLQI